MKYEGAHAVGIANIAMDGSVLDTWFPDPQLSSSIEHSGTTRLGAHDLPPKLLSLVRIDQDRMVEQVAVRTTIADLNEPPRDAHDVYLRLHLLSHRLVKPLEMNMEGALEKLATVVWTNKGPCLPTNFEHVRTLLRSRGLIHVYGVDRLPRMVDYVVPDGVRIAEAERVRLGAYLAPGTKVLREGFVSFNAGTLGPGRVEGRISSGAVVGENFDMGISSTIMCNQNPRELRIGNNCSIGVSSAVLRVNLGDNVHIGNNVILDPDMPLYFADEDRIISASEMDGQSNWQVGREAGHAEPVVRRT